MEYHLLGISAIVRFARHVESMEPGSAFIFVVSRVRRIFQSGNESRTLTLASTARNFQILNRRFLFFAYCSATLITNCQFEKVPEVLSGGVQFLLISVCYHRQASSVDIEKDLVKLSRLLTEIIRFYNHSDSETGKNDEYSFFSISMIA